MLIGWLSCGLRDRQCTSAAFSEASVGTGEPWSSCIVWMTTTTGIVRAARRQRPPTRRARPTFLTTTHRPSRRARRSQARVRLGSTTAIDFSAPRVLSLTRAGPSPGSPGAVPARTVGCLGSARALGSDVALRLQVQDDLLGGLLGRELGRVDSDVGVVGHLVGIGDARELGQFPGAGLGVQALAIACLAHLE